MIDFAWDIGRLHLSFATPADAPVSLTAVQVDGRSIAFGAVADVQPVVEIFLAAEGHGRSGQRRIDSTVGTRLRYDSHQSERTGPLSTLTITQIDAATGLRAVLRLVAHQDIAVVRADVEVVNDGVGLLDLTGVSSIVIAPDGTGDAMRPDDVRLCWARSEWMAENRWIDEPVRDSGWQWACNALSDDCAIGCGDRDRLILAATEESVDLQADSCRVLAQPGNRMGQRIGTVHIISVQLLFKIAAGAEQAHGKAAGKTYQRNQDDGQPELSEKRH